MSTSPKKRRYSNSSASKRHAWAKLSDDELMKIRICDLGLSIETSPLAKRVARLYHELETRSLSFRPHCWFSDDWFSPDGIPGIAIPFFLADERLKRLERKEMLEVEGGTDEWCMRIMRHEAGHAIDTAYRLHRRKSYRQVFGNPSEPYPETYRPRPQSKSYVLHLEPWYAQSHPSEDFAETFAVWLKPRSRWRSQYIGWPALKKISYVDQLMKEIVQEKPKVVSRAKVDPVQQLRKTLGEHYRDRLDGYGVDCPTAFDHHLKKLFTETNGRPRGPSAVEFLQRHRVELCRVVAKWTGEYRYNINQVLNLMIDRCREMNLTCPGDETQLKRNVMVMLTVHTVNYLHGGYHRVSL